MPDKTQEATSDSRINTVERRLDQGSNRMARIEDTLIKNTEATNEVLEIVSMGRSFFRVIGYIGSGIKWLAGLAAGIAALWSFWPHGTPPK